MVGSPSVVGVITGLADRDGRAYDVEFFDEYGETTYAGRLEADRFYPASVVWERRRATRLRCPGRRDLDPAPAQHHVLFQDTPVTPDPRSQAVSAWALGAKLPGLDSNQQPSG